MKKLVWCLMCLILVLPACNQEDEFVKKEVSAETNLSPNRFYGVKYPDGEVQTKGIAQRGKLWYPGHTIKVKFLNGSADYQDKVKTYAAEWELYAGISFEYVTEGNADVRIGFDWNGDRYITWSYTGTDCKMVTDQSDATASFADWDWATETEKQGDVLRVFGQVLGLELEHRHLSFDPNWTDRIADYWEGEIADIPWDNLKEYVFDPLLSSDVIMTEEYDENSIMIWPFTRRYAGNTAREYNSQLSELDKQFIARLYPKDDPAEVPEIVATIITDSVRGGLGGFDVNYYINVDPEGEILIDHGDGNSQTITHYDEPGQRYVRYTYQNAGEYIIKIYNISQKLKEFSFQVKVKSVDISKCQSLTSFGIIENSWNTNAPLTYLDLSKNTNLTYLYLQKVNLSSIDISKNTNLTSLSITNSKLSSLDVSKNINLESLFCNNNYLTFLDLSNNLILNRLKCDNNLLTTLDISENTELTFVNCGNNQINSLNTRQNENLRTLKFDSNLIESINISHFPKINELACHNNPLILNKMALVQLAESLPYLDYDNFQYISIENETSEEWIREICDAKNWPIGIGYTYYME